MTTNEEAEPKKKRKRGRPRIVRPDRNRSNPPIPVLPKTGVETSPVVVSTLPAQLLQLIDCSRNFVSLSSVNSMGQTGTISISPRMVESSQINDSGNGGIVVQKTVAQDNVVAANTAVAVKHTTTGSKPIKRTLESLTVDDVDSAYSTLDKKGAHSGIVGSDHKVDSGVCRESTGSTLEKGTDISAKNLCRKRDKDVHNAEEKRRKTKINNWISKLGTLLSKFPSEKQNKTSILERAFRYIDDNEGNVRCEVKVLLLRIKNLESTIIMLVELLKTHSVPIPDTIKIINNSNDDGSIINNNSTSNLGKKIDIHSKCSGGPCEDSSNSSSNENTTHAGNIHGILTNKGPELLCNTGGSLGEGLNRACISEGVVGAYTILQSQPPSTNVNPCMTVNVQEKLSGSSSVEHVTHLTPFVSPIENPFSDASLLPDKIISAKSHSFPSSLSSAVFSVGVSSNAASPLDTSIDPYRCSSSASAIEEKKDSAVLDSLVTTANLSTPSVAEDTQCISSRPSTKVLSFVSTNDTTGYPQTITIQPCVKRLVVTSSFSNSITTHGVHTSFSSLTVVTHPTSGTTLISTLSSNGHSSAVNMVQSTDSKCIPLEITTQLEEGDVTPKKIIEIKKTLWRPVSSLKTLPSTSTTDISSVSKIQQTSRKVPLASSTSCHRELIASGQCSITSCSSILEDIPKTEALTSTVSLVVSEESLTASSSLIQTVFGLPSSSSPSTLTSMVWSLVLPTLTCTLNSSLPSSSDSAVTHAGPITTSLTRSANSNPPLNDSAGSKRNMEELSPSSLTIISTSCTAKLSPHLIPSTSLQTCISSEKSLQGFGIDNLLVISKSMGNSSKVQVVTGEKVSTSSETTTTSSGNFSLINSKLTKIESSPARKSNGRGAISGHTVAAMLESNSLLSQAEVKIKRNLNPYYISSLGKNNELTANCSSISACSKYSIPPISVSNKKSSLSVSFSKISHTTAELINNSSSFSHIKGSKCFNFEDPKTPISISCIPLSPIPKTNNTVTSLHPLTSNSAPLSLSSSNNVKSVPPSLLFVTSSSLPSSSLSTPLSSSLFSSPSFSSVSPSLSSSSSSATTVSSSLSLFSSKTSTSGVVASTKRWSNVLENAHNSNMYLSCFSLGNRKRQRNHNKPKTLKKPFIDITTSPTTSSSFSAASVVSSESLEEITLKSENLMALKSSLVNSMISSLACSVVSNVVPVNLDDTTMTFSNCPTDHTYLGSAPQNAAENVLPSDVIIKSSMSLAPRMESDDVMPQEQSDVSFSAANLAMISIKINNINTLADEVTSQAENMVTPTVKRTMKDRTVHNKWLNKEQREPCHKSTANVATTVTPIISCNPLDQCASPVISFSRQNNRKRTLSAMKSEQLRDMERVNERKVDSEEKSHLFSAVSLCQSANCNTDCTNGMKNDENDTIQESLTVKKIDKNLSSRKLTHQSSDIVSSNSLPTILNIFAPAPAVPSSSNSSQNNSSNNYISNNTNSCGIISDSKNSSTNKDSSNKNSYNSTSSNSIANGNCNINDSYHSSSDNSRTTASNNNSSNSNNYSNYNPNNNNDYNNNSNSNHINSDNNIKRRGRNNDNRGNSSTRKCTILNSHDRNSECLNDTNNINITNNNINVNRYSGNCNHSDGYSNSSSNNNDSINNIKTSSYNNSNSNNLSNSDIIISSSIVGCNNFSSPGMSNFSAESLVNSNCNVDMIGNNLEENSFPEPLIMGANPQMMAGNSHQIIAANSQILSTNPQLFTNFSADTLLSDSESANTYAAEVIAQSNVGVNQMSGYWSNPWLPQAEMTLGEAANTFQNNVNMNMNMQQKPDNSGNTSNNSSRHNNNLQSSTECSPIKSIISILQSTTPNSISNNSMTLDHFNENSVNNMPPPPPPVLPPLPPPLGGHIGTGIRFQHRNRRKDNESNLNLNARWSSISTATNDQSRK